MSQKGNSVIGSLLWKAGERFLIQGFGLFVQVILARLLLPEDFACLAIIVAIVNYLGLFVNCGLSVVVMQKKDLDKLDVQTLTTASLFIALLIYALLFFLAPFVSDFYNVGNLTWPIRIMSLSLFLSTFNSIQNGLLSREMMFKTIFKCTTLAMPLSAGVGIAMAYLGYGVWSLIVYSLFNTTLVVLFMNMIPSVRLSLGFSWERAKALYTFSGKILLTNLVSAGGDTIRTMTIGKAYKPAALAFYDRAYAYSSLVTQVVNTSISTVLLPVLSRKQENSAQLKDMARRSVCMSAFVMIPVLLLVAVMAEPLVLLVLSDKWLPCAPYLSLFCILRIPGIITSVDKQAYYALGKSGIALVYEIGLLIVNLIMLSVMIQYGVFIIAIGYTIIEYIGNIVLMVISTKVYHYSIRERITDLHKSVLNALVMSLAAYSLAFIIDSMIVLILLQAFVGLVVYCALSYLTSDKNLSFILQKIKDFS